jgi:hypothetical protein
MTPRRPVKRAAEILGFPQVHNNNNNTHTPLQVWRLGQGQPVGQVIRGTEWRIPWRRERTAFKHHDIVFSEGSGRDLPILIVRRRNGYCRNGSFGEKNFKIQEFGAFRISIYEDLHPQHHARRKCTP